MSSSHENQQPQDLQTLSIRNYLNQTVLPLLMNGLTEVAKNKPENPIEFLADFLKENNPEDKDSL